MGRYLNQGYVCISRPQRFGKSMAANMLTAYYSRGCDSGKLFADFQISKDKKEIVIKCYKCVFTGSLLNWLEEGASYDLAELYAEMCKIFAGRGNVLYRNRRTNEK